MNPHRDEAKATEPRDVGRAVRWIVVSVLVLAATWELHRRSAALGGPIPYSDEAAHAAKTAELRWDLARAPGTWERAAVLLFSGDAYPNAAYAAAIAQGATTLEELRRSTVAFLLAHVGIALLYGRRLWGCAGTLAYVALVAFTAYPLAFSRQFYLDVPLVATVGAAAILLEASDGFRRVVPAILFVLVATVGLYTKWMWAAFCGIPCAFAALRAVGAAPGWRSRALGAVGLAALVAGGAWSVKAAGEGMPAGLPQRWPALLQVAAAARVLAGWAAVALVGTGFVLAGDRVPARVRTLLDRAGPYVPLANAALAFGLVGGLAGPWYALVWRQLWGRYDHEQEAFTGRAGVDVATAARVLQDLLPAGAALVGIGLVFALAAREGRAAWATRVLGAAAGAALVVAWLPSDTRYLLPVLPMLAGATVAGWRRAPLWIGGPMLAAVAGIAWATGAGPLLEDGPLDGARVAAAAIHGIDVERRDVRGWPVPVLTTPKREDTAQIVALTDAIVDACGPGRGPDAPCRVSWTSRPGSPLVTRAVLSLVKLRGVDAREEPPGTRGAGVVTGGVGSVAVPVAAWSGDRWAGPMGEGSAWVSRP